jgi:hypothetical protein
MIWNDVVGYSSGHLRIVDQNFSLDLRNYYEDLRLCGLSPSRISNLESPKYKKKKKFWKNPFAYFP